MKKFCVLKVEVISELLADYLYPFLVIIWQIRVLKILPSILLFR